MSAFPSPWQGRGAFARGLLLLVTLLLATAHYGSPPVSAASPQPARLKRWDDVYLQRNCYFFQSLGLDYLNDTELLPHALSVTSGTLEPGQAADFRVLGVSYQGVYPDVAYYFRATRFNSRALRVTVRPAPGSRSVAGKVTLLQSPTNLPQRIRYTPARTSSVDRAALLTFTLLCDPPLSMQFTLQLPAAHPSKLRIEN